MTKTLVLASLTAATLALPGAALANETIAHLKGHTAVAAPVAKASPSPRAACHPDPGKGRDCRHRAMQTEANAVAAIAQTETLPLATSERGR